MNLGAVNLDAIAGVAHQPAGTPAGVALVTHGAGGDRNSPLLQSLCQRWADRGWLAIRYNLPFRRRRQKGPPSGSGAGDRAGILAAIRFASDLADGPLLVGGHSYGGRQTSMVLAELPERTGPPDLLALLSYPVHAPGRPQHPRIEHLSGITVPTVFTHGSSDPFGSLEELRAAAALISAPTEIVAIAGARHDLASKTVDVPTLAIDAALRLLDWPRC